MILHVTARALMMFYWSSFFFGDLNCLGTPGRHPALPEDADVAAAAGRVPRCRYTHGLRRAGTRSHPLHIPGVVTSFFKLISSTLKTDELTSCAVELGGLSPLALGAGNHVHALRDRFSASAS